MNRYLLDTNHLSAYLDRLPTVEEKVDARLRAGDRIGICCRYFASVAQAFGLR